MCHIQLQSLFVFLDFNIWLLLIKETWWERDFHASSGQPHAYDMHNEILPTTEKLHISILLWIKQASKSHILYQFSPIHMFTTYFFQNSYNIIFQSTSHFLPWQISMRFSIKLLPPACYKSHQFQISLHTSTNYKASYNVTFFFYNFISPTSKFFLTVLCPKFLQFLLITHSNRARLTSMKIKDPSKFRNIFQYETLLVIRKYIYCTLKLSH
jgi:hypothetical protein